MGTAGVGFLLTCRARRLALLLHSPGVQKRKAVYVFELPFESRHAIGRYDKNHQPFRLMVFIMAPGGGGD